MIFFSPNKVQYSTVRVHTQTNHHVRRDTVKHTPSHPRCYLTLWINHTRRVQYVNLILMPFRRMERKNGGDRCSKRNRINHHIKIMRLNYWCTWNLLVCGFVAAEPRGNCGNGYSSRKAPTPPTASPPPPSLFLLPPVCEVQGCLSFFYLNTYNKSL